jgi:PPOX class probable F420-dependent enzyme
VPDNSLVLTTQADKENMWKQDQRPLQFFSYAVCLRGRATKAAVTEGDPMMASLSDARVRQLLEGRYIASFATQNPNGSLHIVAVWFWFDGTDIYVATSSRSRKARNLQADPKVSLMIDARDPAASFGVTVTGTAQTLTGDSSRKCNTEIHRKYLSEAAIADPKVGPVFAGWDDVTVRLAPESVIFWDMRDADQQVFGGAFKNNPTYLLPLAR